MLQSVEEYGKVNCIPDILNSSRKDNDVGGSRLSILRSHFSMPSMDEAGHGDNIEIKGKPLQVGTHEQQAYGYQTNSNWIQGPNNCRIEHRRMRANHVPIVG